MPRSQHKTPQEQHFLCLCVFYLLNSFAKFSRDTVLLRLEIAGSLEADSEASDLFAARRLAV